jgi:hypothetical protein
VFKLVFFGGTRSLLAADRGLLRSFKKLEKNMPKALEIYKNAGTTQEKARREHPVAVPDIAEIVRVSQNK